MAKAEKTLFIVGVFKDLAWAEKGIDALREQGFQQAVVSVMMKGRPRRRLVRPKGDRRRTRPSWNCRNWVPWWARVPWSVFSRARARDLGKIGISGAIRRAGFQAHDGLIYETLAERGACWVAIEDPARASDALAILLSYGRPATRPSAPGPDESEPGTCDTSVTAPGFSVRPETNPCELA